MFWLHVTRLQAGAEDVAVYFNTLDLPVRVAVIYPHAELHLGSSEADKLALVTLFSSVQRQSQSHLVYTGAPPQTNKSQKAHSAYAALWMQSN